MGNSNLIDPKAYGRSEQCINFLESQLLLSRGDVKKFYSMYRKAHSMNPRYQYLLPISAFLDFFDIDCTIIHKLIFGWISSQSPFTFSFVEFVTVLCCFLTLKDSDFGKFIFVLFDSNCDGKLESDEIADLVRMVKKEDRAADRPILNILSQLESSGQSLNLSKFMVFYNKHTSLIHPFRQLKCDLRQKCMGEGYWAAKESLKVAPRHISLPFSDATSYPALAIAILEIQSSMETEDVFRLKSNPLVSSVVPTHRSSDPSPLPIRGVSTEGRISNSAAIAREQSTSADPRDKQPAPPLDRRTSARGGVSTKKILVRGNSSDDMLNNMGKPHKKQPSWHDHGRRKNSVAVMMVEEEAVTAPPPPLLSRPSHRRMGAAAENSSEFPSSADPASTQVGLSVPRGARSTRKLVMRQYSGDDMLH
jgi:hypothetical protein